MISISLAVSADSVSILGSTPEELEQAYPELDLVRRAERLSIRRFMEDNRRFLKGRVLDYGAGDRPYRDLVQGEYVPFQKGEPLPEARFDCVICNQVYQYLDLPQTYPAVFSCLLKPSRGYLVMTYATNWDEVEPTDLWRFTKAGMTKMYEAAGWKILVHERRAAVYFGRFCFPLGYGVVMQRA